MATTTNDFTMTKSWTIIFGYNVWFLVQIGLQVVVFLSKIKKKRTLPLTKKKRFNDTHMQVDDTYMAMAGYATWWGKPKEFAYFHSKIQG